MLRKDWDDLNKNGNLGDWCFFEAHGTQYISFRYPSPGAKELPPEYLETYPDRGDIVSLPISTGEKQAQCWLWDGNTEAPTLSPSVNVIDHWHGYLRNGVLETC